MGDQEKGEPIDTRPGQTRKDVVDESVHEEESGEERNNRTPVGELDLLAEKNKTDHDGGEKEEECQSSLITFCDTGRKFGGKQRAKKVRDIVKITIEDKMMIGGVLTSGMSRNEPLTAALFGFHSGKYSDRCRDLGCALPDCWGMGFTCEYGERSFKYCHLHMAAALEEEVKIRHNLDRGGTAEDTYYEWGG